MLWSCCDITLLYHDNFIIAGGTVVDQRTVQITNSTLGRACVPFTAGINPGVVEDDQTFGIELQDLDMPSDVQFIGGQTATVEVIERES